ncbi:MAG: polyprenyl synthetase family protein [Candidatus Gastranaerophilales bacterium]|nr:polyprenyl synthetase family protein [Candidatus Gastranaerophilales bacterium]
MLSFMDDLINKELEIIKERICRTDIPAVSGKMIRSKIGLLIIKSLGIEPTQDYINLFCAIELIHNASLLHDDVIDEETERRGQISLNRQLGNKNAILYGNLLVADAFDYLLKINSINLTSIITQAIKNMCEGELLQKSHAYKIPGLKDYIEKTRLKTSSLFTALTKGIIEISQKENIDYLNEFAENFGIAFQITNDLKNGTKSDIANGIYTAPVIYSGSVTITNTAIEKTGSLIDNYTQKAEKALESLRDSDYKKSLIGVVRCLNK